MKVPFDRGCYGSHPIKKNGAVFTERYLVQTLLNFSFVCYSVTVKVIKRKILLKKKKSTVQDKIITPWVSARFKSERDTK